MQPLEAGPAANMQAAGAEATASPPEAAGCPEEAVLTGAGGAAGPSELVSADSILVSFSTFSLIILFINAVFQSSEKKNSICRL